MVTNSMLAEGLIALVSGVYFTLLSYRLIGQRPGLDVAYDAQFEKRRGWLRRVAPFLIVFGLIMIGNALARQ